MRSLSKIRYKEVGVLDQFEITFHNLKDGLHHHDFEIQDSFFQAFEESLIEVGEGKCGVELDKKTNLLTFDFDIRVSVELTCDRSLEKFHHSINAEKQLVVKFGDEEAEISDEIIVIKRESQQINLAQTIYEFIAIEIPMKKIHPDYVKDNEDEFGEIVYKSDEDKKDENVDPRWNALKNLN